MLRLIIVATAAIGAILFVAFIASRVARSRRTGLSIRMQVFLALALVVGAFAGGVACAHVRERVTVDLVNENAVQVRRNVAGGRPTADNGSADLLHV